MSARNSRFGAFSSRSGRGKAAGAVIACAVMVLAGCGGSGGSAADAPAGAGSPIVRGAATGAVTGVAASLDGDEVHVSWVSAKDGETRNVIGYEVQVSTASTGPWVAADSACGGEFTKSSQASECALNHQPGGKTYSFRVAAITKTIGVSPVKSTGDWSAGSEAVTMAAFPGTPTISSVTVGNTQAEVTVQRRADGGTPTSFSVRAENDSYGSSDCTVTGTAGFCTVTGLVNGAPYSFFATAHNSTGTSGRAQFTPFGPPGAPGIGAVAMTGPTSYAVAFTAPASDGGSAITRYTATSNPAGGSGTLDQAGSGTITVTGLIANTQYTFTVTATNAKGTSAASSASTPVMHTGGTASSSASVPVAPLTVPGAPTIKTVTTVGKRSVWVEYTAPASNGGSVITTYTATSDIGGLSGTAARAGSGRITVTGLIANTQYTFTVTATNAKGISAASSASTPVMHVVDTFTVTFDANGGSGSMASQSASALTALTRNEFTRTDYVFNGWAATPTGSVVLSDAAEYKFDKNVTLYARWATGVVFDANGGSGRMTRQTGQSSGHLSLNEFTRASHVFNGWATTPTGDLAYRNAAKYPFPQSATLYARWVEALAFDSNGGSGAMVAQGEIRPTTLTSNLFGKTGYVFDGWSTTPNGSKAYANGAVYPFPPPASSTLYARWTTGVVFEANGGGGSMANQIASAPTTLTSNSFARTDYYFAGWSTELNGSKVYRDGAVYPFPASATLYARWVGALTFNANGGRGTMNRQGALEPTALRLNVFTREGYVFRRWTNSPTGKGLTTYLDGGMFPFPLEEGKTLYAQWDAIAPVAVPCSPLSVTITKSRRGGQDSANVTFTASSSDPSWNTFTASTTAGGQSATLSTSEDDGTITVRGLRRHTGYSFTVTGTNDAGCSYTSPAGGHVDKFD
jgi:uncharacterized repeat protein (TIGR02543 family)